MVVTIWKEDVPPIQKTLDATYRMDRVADDSFENLIDDWWRRVRDLAKALCREMGAYDTGSLYNTIRIIYSPSIGGGTFRGGAPTFEITGGPVGITVDRMITAGGLLINPKTGRIVNYAESVHDGTGQNYRKGPRPFLSMALEIMEPELMRIMDGMMRRQEKEWDRD